MTKGLYQAITPETVVEDLRKHLEYLDSKVTPAQSSLKVGDFFARTQELPDGNLAIFGEIIESCYPEDREDMLLPHNKNKRMVRAYSALCPEGEMGMAHVSSIEFRLSKERFEEAQQGGWNSSLFVLWACQEAQEGMLGIERIG